MTITVVQSKNVNAAWTGSFGSNVTAGNTVFLTAFSYGGTSMSSSNPTFGGSAASGASQLYGLQDGNGGVYTTVWMLPNLAGGAASFGLTHINGNVDSNVGIAAVEVSGLGSAPALDSGAAPNPSTGSNPLSGTVSSGSTGNITSAPEFIVASGVAFGQNPGTPSPWTTLQPSGFCTAAWQVVTSSGSGYVFTGNTVTVDWASGVAAVEAGGSGSTVSGQVSALSLAAPAGTPQASPVISGAVSALSLAAPAGTLVSSPAVAGPVSLLALNAPAGTVVAGTQVNGQVSALSLAAPAGSVTADATVSGPVAALALAAPAGVPLSSGVTVNGVTANLALVAPPGQAGSGTAASALPQNVNRGGGVFTGSSQPQGSPLGSKYVRQGS